MYLDNNQLTGTLPAPAFTSLDPRVIALEGISDKVVIKRLGLSGNRFTGSLPDGIFRYRMQVIVHQHIFAFWCASALLLVELLVILLHQEPRSCFESCHMLNYGSSDKWLHGP